MLEDKRLLIHLRSERKKNKNNLENTEEFLWSS